MNTAQAQPLAEFQQDARRLIDGLNENKEPLPLTIDGEVQAFLVDPLTFREMEEAEERQHFIDAIREGERAVREGRTQPAQEVFEALKAKHGL